MRIGGDDTIETYALGNLPGQTLEDNFWLDTYQMGQNGRRAVLEEYNWESQAKLYIEVLTNI